MISNIKHVLQSLLNKKVLIFSASPRVWVGILREYNNELVVLEDNGQKTFWLITNILAISEAVNYMPWDGPPKEYEFVLTKEE